jgi:Gpi18-like mannosyltransferase
MGKQLVLWFLFCLIVGFFVAYVTGRTLDFGAHYLAVFRVAGTVAFLSYSAAHAPNSIWMGVSWSTTLKHMFDGLVYGLLTAGMFGWLWPR